MRDENKRIKYSAGLSSEDHENPSDSLSFEVSTKDPSDTSRISKGISYKRHFGSHIPFYWKNHEPQFTVGPHWPFFVCMWITLIAVGILVIVYVASSQSAFSVIIILALMLWEAFIYLYTSLKNPGIASIDPDDPEIEHYKDYPNFCKPCKILKTDDIHHCYDCDVCIRGFDHHCPWTGKCIGEGNLKQFYLFLLSTVVYIVFCILFTVKLL